MPYRDPAGGTRQPGYAALERNDHIVVDESGPHDGDDVDFEDAHSVQTAATDRSLRVIPPAGVRNGVWFSPDAGTLAIGEHPSRDGKRTGTGYGLAFWDVRTAARRVVVTRSSAMWNTAIAPDGTLFCIAAGDGLAVHERMSCALIWEVMPGTTFLDAVFSCDSSQIASIRADEGLLEIWNARTGKLLANVEDFPAAMNEWSPGALSFSSDMLAVGGREGKRSDKQVLLLDTSDFTAVKTLQLDTSVRVVSFSPKGCQLAVGTERPGQLHLFSSEDDWTTPLLWGAPTLPTDGINSLRFSHDGRLLCIGECHEGGAGVFLLWDVEAGVCVREFKHPGFSCGVACAFSPAGDLLVLGGDESEMLVHELLPTKPLRMFAMPGAPQAPIVSHARTSAEVVVLASSSRCAAVRRADDKVLWQMDTEAEISALHFPLALHPSGLQVAVCMNKLQTVLLVDLHTGEEHLLKGSFGTTLGGVNYSPDGSLLMVYGNSGTKVYEATTGKELHSVRLNEDDEGCIHQCVIDPTGRLLATTGQPKCAFVKDLESGEVVYALDDTTNTHGLCFDDKGERFAYFLMGEGSEELGYGQLIICDATDGYHELRRITLPTMPNFTCFALFTQFSPGEGKFMLLTLGVFVPSQWVILDVETGVEPAWGKYLRTMMMPPGDTPWDTIRWVSTQVDDDAPALQPLILQAGVGTELYLIDVSAFIRSFEEDGNFSVEQLNRLSDIDPEAIPVLLERWPHVVNLRDDETGDTVLHHCAKLSVLNTSERTRSRGAAEKWLSSCAAFIPLQNYEGRTALRDATVNQRENVARAFVKGLNPTLPLSRTNYLTQDLVAIGEKWPAQLVDFIELLETNDGFRVFRKLRNLPVLSQTLDGFAVRGSANGSGKVTWVQYESDDAIVKCNSVLTVVALRGFAGMPRDDSLSPYTTLFNAARISKLQLRRLMRTELMKVTTSFKWKSYAKGRVAKRLCLYVAHLVIAAVALLASSQTLVEECSSGLFGSKGDWSGKWQSMDAVTVCDVLHAVLLLTNSCMLHNEIIEVWLTLVEQRRRLEIKDISCWTALKEHLSSSWNLCDIAGIVALYVASAAHFSCSALLLQHVGAIGVLLNAFSFLKLAQPLHVSMGTLIEVLIRTGSSSEVLGFGGVLLVLIWGFGAAFSVSMPKNTAFYTKNHTLLPGFLTTTMAMVGDFDVDLYEFGIPCTMFILFLYIVIIVMFNVLIAIVSDLYNDVKETEDVEVDMRRAEAIIRQEAGMSDAEKLNGDDFPEFLEVLRVESTHESVEHVKVSKVQDDVAKLSTKLEQKLELQTEEIDKIAGEVAKLTVLMQQFLAQGDSKPKGAPTSLHSVVEQMMAQNRVN